MSRILCLCGLAFGVVVLIGCAAEPKPPPPPAAADALKELTAVYKYLDYSKAAPPRRLEDLTQFIDTLPTAYYRLQSGEFQMVYGVGMSTSPANGSQVLAYERKAATEGGAVLLRDGTIKQMTAAEFSAAPKAK
jgi:hypothetical protein